ncbi:MULTISPECIES: hypothetical protein [Clostridium]|uniref:hypothetical protein n=1 Tax=Clostridium TaxID=1485 RepID=UPI0008250D29|nr:MULTISPECIES: hypothetical protein [Clostridium]PJI09692.1 hypothetical protein CUB90_18285 [Clostridium sp. CT7]
MDELEKWIKDYSLKKGVNYEKTIIEALKFYREFIEGNGHKYYNLGKKLKGFIDENAEELLKVSKDTKAFKGDEHGTIRFQCIQNFDEKERYLKSMENINSNLINIILNDRTIILKGLQNEKNISSAIISFENFGTNEAKYAFVHYLRVLNSKYKKIYPAIESEIINLAKKFGVNRIDRVVSDDLLSNFKSMGYTELYRNCYLRIDNNNCNLVEYEKEVKHRVGSRYVPIFKMCPNRFEEKDNVNELYRFTMRAGKFYAQINIKGDKAFGKLYLDKDKLNKASYIKYLYYTIISYIKKNNIKNLYTLIDKRHINVLGSIENARKIKEWVWIRKLL